MKIIIIDDSLSALRDMRFSLEHFLGHKVLTIGFNQKPPQEEYEAVFRKDGAFHDLYTISIDEVVLYIRKNVPDFVLVDHQIHPDEESVSGFHIVQELPDMIDKIIGISGGGCQPYCKRIFHLKSQLVPRSDSGCSLTLTETQQSALDKLATVIDSVQE